MTLVHGTLHWNALHVLSRKLVLNMPKEPCVAEDSQGDDSAVPTTKQEYTETATCYTLCYTLYLVLTDRWC